MITVKQILDALKGCVDPELGIGIVDMGLIYGISINGSDVKLTMTMTSPMCPVTSIILADAQLRIKAIEGAGKVDIDLVWEPAWSPEMMSEDTKAQLSMM